MTKTLDLLLADRKAELLRWLSEEGRFAPDTGGLLEMLCEKLAVLNLAKGRGDKPALIGPAGTRTYAELCAQACRWGNGLAARAA